MLIGNEMDNLLPSINAIIALGADRNSFGALKRPREGVDARSTAMSVDDSSDEDIPISNLVSLKKRGAQIAQPSATKTTAEAAAPEPKHKNRKLRAEASNASLRSDGTSEGGTPGPQHDADAAGGGPSLVSDSGPNAAGPPIVKTPNDDDASLADLHKLSTKDYLGFIESLTVDPTDIDGAVFSKVYRAMKQPSDDDHVRAATRDDMEKSVRQRRANTIGEAPRTKRSSER